MPYLKDTKWPFRGNLQGLRVWPEEARPTAQKYFCSKYPASLLFRHRVCGLVSLAMVNLTDGSIGAGGGGVMRGTHEFSNGYWASLTRTFPMPLALT